MWGERICSEEKICDLYQFGNTCLDSTHPQKSNKTYSFGCAFGSESHLLTLRQENQEYHCS